MAWVMLAEYELDAGDARKGEAAAFRALALRPGHPEALARLGRAQSMMGRKDDAVASLQAAAHAAPAHAGIAVWLAHALEAAGAVEASSEAYAHAYALASDEPQLAAYLLACRRKLCDWRDVDALSAQVRDAVRAGRAAVDPFSFLSEEASAAEQLRSAQLRAAAIGLSAPIAPAPAAHAAPLRIGFLSNGFGAHPTGLLTVAFFEHLRKAQGIQAHLFALGNADGSAMRDRLERAAHAFHDLGGRPHGEVAQGIAGEAIDILFDLRGWGDGGAPEALALRPAPIQVNWLAYPGTSGAPWIDYVLADRFVIPDRIAHGFSECVVRLSRCFQPSDTRRAIEPAPSRAQCGLPADGVVFCCFNNSYKLNRPSFDRLLRILGATPDSVLWLLSAPGRGNERLRTHAQQHGVAPDRLVFMDKQPHPTYLARLALADLFLDTNPYNAHTTASDALWAGCPVLTRPGDTFASRVAGSLNVHIGMAELNVSDDDAYVTTAIALARDEPRRTRLRERLQRHRQTHGLFDMAGFADDFVAACRQMDARHRNGLAPAAFDLPPAMAQADA